MTRKKICVDLVSLEYRFLPYHLHHQIKTELVTQGDPSVTESQAPMAIKRPRVPGKLFSWHPDRSEKCPIFNSLCYCWIRFFPPQIFLKHGCPNPGVASTKKNPAKENSRRENSGFPEWRPSTTQLVCMWKAVLARTQDSCESPPLRPAVPIWPKWPAIESVSHDRHNTCLPRGTHHRGSQLS